MKKISKYFITLLLAAAMALPMLLSPVSISADQTVYTTATGSKYHYSKNCKGLSNAKKIYEESLASAKAKGLSACSICASGTAGKQKTTKSANPITVKGKTATVKYSVVKNQAQKLKVGKVLKVSNAKGTVTYTKVSGNSKIVINKTTGKVTVKKGIKKNSYKIKVKVKAAGNSSYKAKTVTATFTIKID